MFDNVADTTYQTVTLRNFFTVLEFYERAHPFKGHYRGFEIR